MFVLFVLKLHDQDLIYSRTSKTNSGTTMSIKVAHILVVRKPGFVCVFTFYLIFPFLF